MTTNRILAPAAMAVFVTLASASFAQNQSEESREQTVQLSQVPKAARDAAQKALGTAPTEAKIVTGTSPQEYELEAKGKAGKESSVHVLADGKVIKREQEEQDND